MSVKFSYAELEQRVLELEKAEFDHREVEEALRKSEKRIQSVFRSAPTGIGVVTDRVINQANKRLCEMIGYSAQELVGQSARILYPSDQDFEYVGHEKYAQIRDHGTGTVETRWRLNTIIRTAMPYGWKTGSRP